MNQPVNPSTPAPGRKIKIAALISGGGTTVLNIADKIEAGQLDAEIVQVIASRPNIKGIERAASRGIPVTVLGRKQYDSAQAYCDELWPILRNADTELVCLAGWLNLLIIPDDFADKVLNIHPGLLPSFGGKGMFGHHVHQAVIDHGCKISGCTVHFADQTYDTGPIIVQRTCPVAEDDTADSLAERVFEQECLAYPEAIQLFAEGRVKVEGRRVRIAPAK